jgi:hypothetical protein
MIQPPVSKMLRVQHDHKGDHILIIHKVILTVLGVFYGKVI